jgi:hypothetical protein
MSALYLYVVSSANLYKFLQTFISNAVQNDRRTAQQIDGRQQTNLHVCRLDTRAYDRKKERGPESFDLALRGHPGPG